MTDPTPLASQRDLFEIPREVAYLNAAAYVPLPRAVREDNDFVTDMVRRLHQD